MDSGCGGSDYVGSGCGDPYSSVVWGAVMSLSRQGSTPGSERTSGLLADPSAGISPPPPVATSPGTRKSQRPPRSRARGPSQRCPASGRDLPRSDALYPAPSNYTTNRATRRTTTARTAESTPLRSNTQTAVPHTPTPSPTQIKAFYIRSTPACHLSPPSDAEPIETRPCPLRGRPGRLPIRHSPEPVPAQAGSGNPRIVKDVGPC